MSDQRSAALSSEAKEYKIPAITLTQPAKDSNSPDGYSEDRSKHWKAFIAEFTNILEQPTQSPSQRGEARKASLALARKYWVGDKAQDELKQPPGENESKSYDASGTDQSVKASIDLLLTVPPELIVDADYFKIFSSLLSPKESNSGPIQVHIVDYDGHGEFLGACTPDFIKQYVLILQRKDKEKNAPARTEAEYIKQAQEYWNKNQKLIHDFLLLNSQNMLTLLFSGSSRIDLHTDKAGAAHKGNGSSFRQFQEFCDKNKLTFYPSLLADFDNKALPGTAMREDALKGKGFPWRAELEKLQDELEEGDTTEAGILAKVLHNIDDYYNKVRINAYCMRLTAILYPNSSITVHFSDDREDILAAVYVYFATHPQLIPSNVKLKLWHGDYNIAAAIDACFDVLSDTASLLGTDFRFSGNKELKYENPRQINSPLKLSSIEKTGLNSPMTFFSPTTPFSPVTPMTPATPLPSLPFKSVPFPPTPESPSTLAFADPQTYGFAVEFIPPDEKNKKLGDELFDLDDKFSKYLTLSSDNVKQFKRLLLRFIATDSALAGIPPADADAMIAIHKVLSLNEQTQETETQQSSSDAKTFKVAGDWHNNGMIISLIEKCAALSLNSLIVHQDVLQKIYADLTSASASDWETINACCDQLMKIEGLFFSSLDICLPLPSDNKNISQKPRPAEIMEKLAKLQSYFVSLGYWSNEKNLKKFFHAMPEELISILSSVEQTIKKLHSRLFQQYSSSDQKPKQIRWLWDLNKTLEASNKLYNSYLNGFRSSLQSPDKKMKVKQLKQYQETMQVPYLAFLERCYAVGLIDKIILPKNAVEAKKLGQSLIKKLQNLGEVPSEIINNIQLVCKRLYKLQSEAVLSEATFSKEQAKILQRRSSLNSPPSQQPETESIASPPPTPRSRFSSM